MRPSSKVTRALTLVVVPLLLMVGFSLVLAQQYVQADERINQIAHFGGDAFYCIDANANPTNQFSQRDATAFRLLNTTGQELWFVPRETVAAVLAQAVRGGAPALIATGRGSYGETALYVVVQEDGQRFFTLTGYDEHGKSNSLTFEDCTPVGSTVPLNTTPPVVSPTAIPTITPTPLPTWTPLPT